MFNATHSPTQGERHSPAAAVGLPGMQDPITGMVQPPGTGAADALGFPAATAAGVRAQDNGLEISSMDVDTDHSQDSGKAEAEAAACPYPFGAVPMMMPNSSNKRVPESFTDFFLNPALFDARAPILHTPNSEGDTVSYSSSTGVPPVHSLHLSGKISSD